MPNNLLINKKNWYPILVLDFLALKILYKKFDLAQEQFLEDLYLYIIKSIAHWTLWNYLA
jgi:hypothetical protein